MKLKKLHVEAAGVNVAVELPSHGLILVTGSNGHGKSILLVDAICWALFGKSPRSIMAEGQVRLDFGDLVVARVRKKQARLAWSMNGEERAFESTTKAQEALEQVVGSFESFTTTTFFNSRDGGFFTQATDKWRKASVAEMIPGFANFEEALARCKIDLKSAEARKMRAHGEHAAAHAVRLAADARIADLGAEEPLIDISCKTARLAEVYEAKKALAAERLRLDNFKIPGGVQSAIDARQSDLGAQLYRVRALKDKKKLIEGGFCPTCGQATVEKIAEVAQEIAAAERGVQHDQQALEALQEKKKKSDEARSAYIAEIVDRGAELQREELALVAEIAQQKAHNDNQTRQAALRVRLLNEVSHAKGIEETAGAALAAAQTEISELEQCEKVLSARGLPAVLIKNAVDALCIFANNHLRRFWPGVTLKLGIDAERQTIDMSVDGLAHSETSCLSTGELRRLDAALFFARRDLLGARHGLYIFDEALDGLDSDGVASVGGYLAELARDSQVIVISHSQEVWGGLRWDARWWLDDGRLFRR